MKKLLPGAVLRELQVLRALDRNEWGTYVKLRSLNSIGLTRPREARIPSTATAIVFVCFGNIIRSPACEALMKHALASRPDLQLRVASAGLNAVPGRGAHPWAISIAPEFGISLDEHRARQLTPELVAQADVIFAMDYQNQVQLLSRWKDSRHKVYLLSAYAGKDYRSLEIPDPYYLGLEETRQCYAVLSTCVQNLVSSLLNPANRETGT